VALEADVDAEDDWVASAVLDVEVMLATRRGDGDLVLARRRLLDVELIPLSTAVRQRARGLSGLRTLDAIHLATALAAPGLDAFYCYDARLGAVARRAGLPVRSPGYAAGHGEEDD
jgi:predicted nucleic acid-binding protein